MKLKAILVGVILLTVGGLVGNHSNVVAVVHNEMSEEPLVEDSGKWYRMIGASLWKSCSDCLKGFSCQVVESEDDLTDCEQMTYWDVNRVLSKRFYKDWQKKNS